MKTKTLMGVIFILLLCCVGLLWYVMAYQPTSEPRFIVFMLPDNGIAMYIDNPGKDALRGEIMFDSANRLYTFKRILVAPGGNFSWCYTYRGRFDKLLAILLWIPEKELLIYGYENWEPI